MKRWLRSAILMTFVTGFLHSVTAQDSVTARTEVRQLSESLYLLATAMSGSVTNSLLYVGADDAVLVDHPGDWRTLTADDETISAVRRAMTALGVRKPARLINTHWHGDHTAGNVIYSDSADVISHENVRARLMTRQHPWWYPDGIGPMDAQGWPDVTFVDSMTLHATGQTIRLWNFGRAHTDGDAVVFFQQANVVHLGDMFHGLRDPSVGEDMVGLARTLNEVVQKTDEATQVVTGHDGVTTREELIQYVAMLRETIDHVERAVTEGLELIAIQERGVPERWQPILTDTTIVNAWIQEIHRSLTTGNNDS